MTKETTTKVVGGTTILLLAYELYTLIDKDKEDTISESIWDIAVKRPLVPFAFGLLCGHFFWQKAS